MTPAESPDRTARWRIAGLSVLLLLALGWAAGLHQPLFTWWHRASPPAPTVLFVVLDTVRSDHLSVCGYERPTSPGLEALRARGATVACEAYAPSGWTLPSHASFFTGVLPNEHGARYPRGDTDPLPLGEALVAAPLDDRLPTLAEEMAERGFATAMFSGNPLVSEAAGLARGFEQYEIVPFALRGERWVGSFRRFLRGVEAEGRPLFLFVNIAHAHTPLEAVPGGAGWGPARDEIGIRYEPYREELAAYMEGELPDEWADEVLAHLADSYDYGVHRADRALERVLEVVERHGWSDAGLRLVVTSDHGELLGGHQLIGHGHAPWDGVTRVPLVVWHSDGTQPSLPEPVTAISAYHLVLDGVLPEEGMGVRAVTFDDRSWHASMGGPSCGSAVAAWEQRAKALWRSEDSELRIVTPGPGEEPALRAARTLVDEVQQLEVLEPSERSEETVEALRALGYIE